MRRWASREPVASDLLWGPCSRRPDSCTFLRPFLPRFLRSFVRFVILRSGCPPRQTSLSHQSPDVTHTVLNVEPLDKILASKWNRPCRCVYPDFFRWFMESFNELLMLLFDEFWRFLRAWFVVYNVLERLETEPFEAVEPLPLRSPSFWVAVELCCIGLANPCRWLQPSDALRQQIPRPAPVLAGGDPLRRSPASPYWIQRLTLMTF